MTGRQAFEIWAPAGSRWVDWVRPVAFISGPDSPMPNVPVDGTIPDIPYLSEAGQHAALIVDLPGDAGIKEGLALARLGFRPIPLYNGTNGQQGALALVDNRPIERDLRWGASVLEKIPIPQNAPPAFLLDSNRTHQYKMDVSVFDNSWDVYAQDMPSAEYLLGQGIREIIVRGESIQKDLHKILYPLQKEGITILFTKGYSQPTAVALKKPAGKRI